MAPDYISAYWGKAQAATSDGQQWHPLAYHCLDVAAVADALLSRSPRKLFRLAEFCRTSPDVLRRALVVMIALHDIGKFSLHFQAKSEAGWQTSAHGPRPDPKAGIRHDAIGYAMLDTVELDDKLGPYFSDGIDDELWTAVAGHHGAPATEPHSHWRHGLQKGPDKAAKAFVADVVEFLPALDSVPCLSKRASAILSWSVAGLTVISDWIGSSERWFPYTAPDLSLHDPSSA